MNIFWCLSRENCPADRIHRRLNGFCSVRRWNAHANKMYLHKCSPVLSPSTSKLFIACSHFASRNHSMLAKLQVQNMNWRLLDETGLWWRLIIILFARCCECDDCWGWRLPRWWFLLPFAIVCAQIATWTAPMLIIFNDFINGEKITLVFILNIVYSLCIDWLFWCLRVCVCVHSKSTARNAYLSLRHVLQPHAKNFWN